MTTPPKTTTIKKGILSQYLKRNVKAMQEHKQKLNLTDKTTFILDGNDVETVITLTEKYDIDVILANKSILQDIKDTYFLKPAEKNFVITYTGTAADKLRADIINETGCNAFIINMAGNYDSVEQRANAEQDAFFEYIKETEKNPPQAAANEQSNAAALDGFFREIAESSKTPAIKTGFETLDAFLDGGLYTGLYLIAAGTSAGKTAFTLQICDQIAANGTDVLYFSLEMSRNEIIARSISRLTYQKAQSKAKSELAKTTRGILAGHKYANYSVSEREHIQAAAEEYKQSAEHIFITEGVGDIKISGAGKTIAAKIEEHIANTGRRPVIVVDYFQLIAPYSDKYSDKQNADKNILELKRLSRDYKLPIIAISSINRDGYNTPINLSAIKESGGIEFCCDTIIGLEYSDIINASTGARDSEKAKIISDKQAEQNAKIENGAAVEITAKILKNRNGKRGNVIFEYTPKYNYFEIKDIPFSNTSAKRLSI